MLSGIHWGSWNISPADNGGATLSTFWVGNCLLSVVVCCRVFSGIPDLYPPYVSSSLIPSCDNKKCLQMLQWPVGGEIIPQVENYWFRQRSQWQVLNRDSKTNYHIWRARTRAWEDACGGRHGEGKQAQGRMGDWEWYGEGVYPHPHHCSPSAGDGQACSLRKNAKK